MGGAIGGEDGGKPDIAVASIRLNSSSLEGPSRSAAAASSMSVVTEIPSTNSCFPMRAALGRSAESMPALPFVARFELDLREPLRAFRDGARDDDEPPASMSCSV